MRVKILNQVFELLWNGMASGRPQRWHQSSMLKVWGWLICSSRPDKSLQIGSSFLETFSQLSRTVFHMIPRLLYTLKLIQYQILRNTILVRYCKKFQIIHIFQFEFVYNNVFQKSFKYGNVWKFNVQGLPVRPLFM